MGNNAMAIEMYSEALKLKPDFTLAAKGMSRVK
jgi:hypothetical protein